MPVQVIHYNMQTGKRATKKVQPVLGGFSSGAYTTERLWATAADGTKVGLAGRAESSSGKQGEGIIWDHLGFLQGALSPATHHTGCMPLIKLAYLLSKVGAYKQRTGHAWSALGPGSVTVAASAF
jgi:hypothetical protein